MSETTAIDTGVEARNEDEALVEALRGAPPVPLVGREEAAAAVLATLLDPDSHGALVLGEAGLGKTALAREVVAQAGGRIRPFHVYASPVLASVPYGALAPLLTSLTPGMTGAPTAVVRALMATLRGTGDAGGPAVVVIDDAQHLDDSSAMAIAAVAAAGAAKTIFLCRPFPAPPSELVQMSADGLLERVVLEPLAPASAEHLCRLLLGGAVMPSTAAVLGRAAGGNPLYLRELIEQARTTGALLQRNELWLLVAEPTGYTPRLMELVRNQIMALTPLQREALETIALAESIELSVLQRTASSTAVDELEEAQLVRVDSDAERTVRILQPLVGEVIRALVPTARSLSIRRQIIANLHSRPATTGALLRYVQWALEWGVQVPDEDILAAAGVANRLFLPDFVEAATQAISDPALRGAARVELARALLCRGDDRSALGALSLIVEEDQHADVVRSAALLRGQLAVRSGAGANGVAQVVQDWTAAIARLQAAGAMDGAQAARHEVGARLLAIQGEHAQGRYLATEDELHSLWAQAHDNPANRVMAGALLGEVLAVTGRPLSAVQVLNDARELFDADPEGLSESSEYLLRRYLLALLNAGEFEVRAAFLADFIDGQRASLLYYGGAFHLAQGLGELVQGGVASALGMLSAAVEGLRESDPGNDLPMALAAAAYAASALGRGETAANYVQAFHACCPARGMLTSLLSRAYASAARASLPGGGGEGAKLLELAAEASGLGALGVEMEILTLAIHAGKPAAAARLAEAAALSEGRAAEFSLDFGTALVRRDAAALVKLSEVAASQGRDLPAAQCAAAAVAILERRGDRGRIHDAARALKRRNAALGHLGAASTGNDGPAAAKLTRREAEIARMVHDGASNRDIAVELSLSLRTVEGHLYRMFAKLGIAHRDELAKAAYDPWQA
ncbi:helix-turn-helix domain-containing protein [Arthrobacter sp. 35W]|uniref:helix-turn-helix domain-containing protein n=1 Tax=Arthrobacter sp. 35W TaxID=1132441 RepID=UPI0004108358|nr:helix-turn-helix transcriptional regulator [Arthrobacter sp. 35W]